MRKLDGPPTVDECLDESMRCETLARQCGALDPAFEFLIRDRNWWLNEAIRLEKELQK